MKKVNKKYNSIRFKLFITLAISVAVIILFLIILNNIVLESFYLYTKQGALVDIYDEVNKYYNMNQSEKVITNILSNYAIKNNYDIILETQDGINLYTSNENFIQTINEMNALRNEVNKYYNMNQSEKVITNILSNYAIKNNYDIILETQDGINLYTSNENFIQTINEMNALRNDGNKNVIYINKNVNIKKIKDPSNNITYMLLSGTLDNNYSLYIRMPISSIQESVKISNTFLYLIGGITLIIAAIIITFISKRFTEPIQELNEIAEKMARLDFSKKFHPKDVDDEIDDLGKNINIMSDKLEGTIQQLRNSNVELEKDIEEKSKIEEMRTQFISDVSHELKTPIALIQGYAEGLVENVNSDEENRQFYADVILDEANKMDKLVKQLLELMKLEYGKREFQNANFNITELIQEVIRKSKVMLEENNIDVKIEMPDEVMVYADEFYIEQVVTNYVTNAIKHAKEIFNEKYIKVTIEKRKRKDKVRISVFNTGDNIEEENLQRIWRRFYKVDSSRNRANGGTGIGLSLVKAIMNNYNNDFGVRNKDTGVEFYFDLDIGK